MQIAATTINSSTVQSTATKPLVSYNDFMQLLVAQLKNQDPTKPMDSSQYVSQLASLSQLEQSVNQTASLNTILAMSYLSQAANSIGLRATSADGLTTGVVQSTRIDGAGVVATLDNGNQLSLDSNVSLARP